MPNDPKTPPRGSQLPLFPGFDPRQLPLFPGFVSSSAGVIHPPASSSSTQITPASAARVELDGGAHNSPPEPSRVVCTAPPSSAGARVELDGPGPSKCPDLDFDRLEFIGDMMPAAIWEAEHS